MPDIYEQHKAAFANVSAYVVLDKGKDATRLATVAFKYPRDGAGRLYCYLHIFGAPMVRGFASGGGYDKHTAAASAASRKIQLDDYRPEDHEAVTELKEILRQDGGHRWDYYLEQAGFKVLQAV